jgi:hypothetical protein
MPLLCLGLGDPVPGPEEHRLLGRRRVRRVRGRRRALRRAGARRHRPDGRRAAHLRRCDHLQGPQGLRRPLDRPGEHRRDRRPRPPRGAVRRHRRGHRRRCRRAPGEARPGQAARCHFHGRRVRRGPGRGHPGSGRRRRRDRPHGQPGSDPAGPRLAAGRWPARARLAAEGRRAHGADLRDRAQGHQHHRVDRRHPTGPARGLRAARRRPHPGHRRRLEQVNEAFDEVLAGDVPARLVFRF